MATVTGFTAARMQEIEDTTIVDGNIVGDDLILIQRDLTEINAGNVRGIQGIQGPVGPTSIVVCTSGTRPTGGALFEGLFIYETDTDRVYSYNGTTWVYRGGTIICTSGTRPGSPFEGLEIYETDTDKRWIYDGATWNIPKNMAGGVLGYAQVTADQAGIGAGSLTDLTGLSIAVTVGAGRRIRVKGNIRGSNTGANSNELYIREGGTSLQIGSVIASTSTETIMAEVILTPTAGAHTYKLTANCGAGTMTMRAASTTPAFILVEDIGGA